MFLKKLINKSINKGYEANECELCLLEFNMLKFDRIHKCKRCLKYVCSSCAQFKQLVIDQEGNQSPQKHRVCIKCKRDISIINDTITKYNMHWQKDSILARGWLMNIKKLSDKDYEYQHFLSYFHKSGVKFEDEIQIIQKDVIRGRTDFSVFNYSMKQFFYTIQNVQNQHITRLNIANVLYAIAARFDKVGYCQGMSGIAAFLLCFAQEETAFMIFCDLIQNIFPPMFFQRNSCGVALIGLLAEIYFLKQYYWHYVGKKKVLMMKQMEAWYTEQEEYHTKMVIELAGTKALLSIFIGVLNFTNLIFVWEELKSRRTFEVVEKAFLAIIYQNRNNIVEQRSFKKLETYFQMLNSQSFIETYHDIEIDPVIRSKLIAQFYQENQTKWSSSKNGNAYTLSKVTNLTEDQIKQLQNFVCLNFTNQQIASRVAMNQEDFMRFISIYYQVLKVNSTEGEQILQMTPIILKKMFKTYASKPSQGLIFRQFIGCFSICTKSCLKDRICAIISSFQDSQGKISYESFNKIMSSLILLSPKRFQSQKSCFMERMTTYFVKSEKIALNDLYVLLSDIYINEMSNFIRSDCQDIVRIVIQQFNKTVISPNQKQVVVKQISKGEIQTTLEQPK